MSPTTWKSVFRLLGLMVLIDDRVYQEEVESFVSACIKLRDILNPNMMFTRKMAFDWFLAHRDSLSEALQTQTIDTLLRTLASGVEEKEEHVNILRALEMIAASDGHKHPRELLILKKLAGIWNIRS